MTQRLSSAAKQVWFVDDGTSTAGGKAGSGQALVVTVEHHWSGVQLQPQCSKSWLIVKEEHFNAAERLFVGTGMNVTVEGETTST